MARRRGRRSRTGSRMRVTQRDARRIARRPRLLRRVRYPQYYEDRRRFEPLTVARRPSAVVESAARVDVAHSTKMRRTLTPRLGFVDPRRVFVCMRRSIRREVLFASGAGGRPGRKKQYRRGPYSDVRC